MNVCVPVFPYVTDKGITQSLRRTVRVREETEREREGVREEKRQSERKRGGETE